LKEGKLSKFIILIFSSFLKEEYPEGGRWLVIFYLTEINHPGFADAQPPLLQKEGKCVRHIFNIL
jgi:hypothetical protein